MLTIDTNRRLAKNTMFLYFRMFIIMAVTFYTTRVLLQVLGVDDFGIFNTIAGIVVLFAFLQNAMVTTTQRFLNYYLGKGNLELARSSFSMSMLVHLCIGILVIVFAEIIGLWFLYYKMSLPPNRFSAAFWTLHLSIAITFVNIIKSPYNSCIIAYEKMDFYAYLSILEAVLKLLIVFLLSLTDIDNLVFYGVLLLLVSVVITCAYIWFCNSHYDISRLVYRFDPRLFSDLFHFSFFSLFGNAANMGAQQGVNLLVNAYTNVAVNAAIGVSNQLSQGVFQFVTNFQIAFNPILVKLYAQNEIDDLKKLICQVTKFSFYLMIVISLPLLVYTDEYLQLWLKNVPDYTVDFCRFTILALLVDTIAEPLWKTIQASGDIKCYQIITSLIIISNLPAAYVILVNGLSPVYIFVFKLIVNIIAYVYRAFFVRRLIDFDSFVYVKHVLLPISIVSLFLLFIGYFFGKMDSYILSSFMMFPVSIAIVFYIGLSPNERNQLSQMLIRKIRG